MDRIYRDWSRYADRTINMTTDCIGATRPQVPGTISLEDAYFTEKYVNGSTLSFSDYEEVFKGLTKLEKRKLF